MHLMPEDGQYDRKM